jgi:acetyl esterase/lipase
MSSPEPGRVTVENDIVFGSGGGRDLRCDVYTPPGAPKDAPGVLLVHGGGWSSGDRTQLKGYGILLGRLGYVCVASEYRLSGESKWPAQIHDVKAALRWMKANRSQLGVDPDRIAVEGNSAGAHLSLVVAGTPNLPEFEGYGGNAGVDTSVAASIGIYAPTDFGDGPLGGAVEMLMGTGASQEAIRGASPVTHVSPQFPPTLLIHGNKDEIVPVEASLNMYAKLAKAGVPTELHVYAGQPHAFDSHPLFGRQCALVMDLFLQRYITADNLAASAAG